MKMFIGTLFLLRQEFPGRKVLQLDGSHYWLGLVLTLDKAHLSPLQVQGTVDERNMREGLRVVPQRPVGTRVDLLGKQAQSPGIGQEALEERARLINSPHHCKVIHQPEGTHGKDTL